MKQLNEYELARLKNELNPSEWQVFNYLLVRGQLSHRAADLHLVFKKFPQSVNLILKNLKEMNLVTQDQQGHWKVDWS